MTYFVGLDWAAREHAVCVIDGCGAVVTRYTVAHTAAGMVDFVARLTKLAQPVELRVAIERPTGLIVDTLVEGGFAVVPIHPNVVKSARPRYSAAQVKLISATRTCWRTCCAPRAPIPHTHATV